MKFVQSLEDHFNEGHNDHTNEVRNSHDYVLRFRGGLTFVVLHCSNSRRITFPTSILWPARPSKLKKELEKLRGMDIIIRPTDFRG